ncbi:hypothetical protein NOF04DRAFT_5155 [Fusarium oxysporum II5]|uniref:Uncharacterized protein n=3 Tax=Fusarium oxysporum species complex TaxID=171631 RepID=N1S4S3_FUSC4|nr:uncharacterized protein FOIG_08599 [Fusarium odoratissimum NRRL 54006]EMT71527.1 hypothetical protein FOC4_g10010032 [Fusarium odoratissimum]EXL99561.1 hypothetical protein FOIG_08599 [Fusarium odoratissimum NRRL 54006]KAK2125143.1 hypothetical protein NOF04DRAFT_5155 [Fusarium oxysporum II5]TXC02222.1 hypothetical protein FocTR4_00015544 [Fusarium oxysporum f. sp. cubense]
MAKSSSGSSSGSSFTFQHWSSSGSSPRSPYKGRLLDVTPLSYGGDYKEWVRQMKYNFDTKGTIALIEKDDGPGFAATKQEKAAWEAMVKDEKGDLLRCLDAEVCANVTLSPWIATSSVKQTWHAIRMEILGMSLEEAYSLLSDFNKLKDARYPSPQAFLDTIDDGWTHINRHFPSPQPDILKLIVALEGIKNLYGKSYANFWRGRTNTSHPTYQDLKDFIEREAQLEPSLFNATENSKDIKAKTGMFRNVIKSKTY